MGKGAPAKRMRGDNGVAWATGGTDPRKERLVQAIKAFQRQGEQFKQLWWQYADSSLGGIRDPARHDYDTLQEFVVSNNVPQANGASMYGNGASMYGQDTKASLIQKIKNFQKQGDDNKETWGAFAGSKRDP